ncbi:hypothetical protein [Vulcanococcus sp.]|uniref:hypothetical protein n=1 Tax=Vulcanococcus sp. TaxID=2856995 RepID=UPI003C1122D2
MTYTHCRTLTQVREVLRNYGGYIYKEPGGIGYVISLGSNCTFGQDRDSILQAANTMFKAKGMRATSFAY